MPPLLLKLIFDRIETGPMPFFIRPIARAISQKVKSGFINPQIKTHFDFQEGELAKSTWFAGEEITGADIQMSFPLEAAVSRGGDRRDGSVGRPRYGAGSSNSQSCGVIVVSTV